MDNMKQATDWNIYYSKPKSWFSTFTQKYTLEFISNIMNKNFKAKGTIVECGGGNSCFANAIVKRFSPTRYDIIDNCEIAVKKAQDNVVINSAYNMNLLENVNDNSLVEAYDLVYSIGLVEHFTSDERKKIIENHFLMCKKGGLVIITAPTPTAKYRFIRKLMEFVHMWQFWDEHPIPLESLIDDMKEYGDIVVSDINKKLPLTQAVVAVIKK